MIARQDIEQILQNKNVNEFKDYWTPKYLPFEEARAFVRKLKLKSQKEWKKYYKNKKLLNIPLCPNAVYETQWKGWYDWFDNGLNRNFKPYKSAQIYVKKLGLKCGQEWKKYAKSNKKPFDIPTQPSITYKNKGWIDMCAWLGVEKKPPFMIFEKARTFVRSLKLKNYGEWRDYSKKEKPLGIPADPNTFYKNKGWISVYDWIGAGRNHCFRSFEESKAFVKKLKLKSWSEWKAYCKSGKKPVDIPSCPEDQNEWISASDWLGKKESVNFWVFKKARVYARNLKLKGTKDWFKYARSKKKSPYIPKTPNSVYKEDWISWFDWLGAGMNRNFRSFSEAISYSRKLKLKNQAEWQKYSKSKNKPPDIPADPSSAYKNKGWINWSDWLGTIKKPS